MRDGVGTAAGRLVERNLSVGTHSPGTVVRGRHDELHTPTTADVSALAAGERRTAGTILKELR